MIAGIFHEGSGLGNQLHRYVAVRCLALDKGYEWTMINPNSFKGTSFLNLSMGTNLDFVDYDAITAAKSFVEKKVVENGVDIRGYDPEFNFIEDNTVIDGEFQDERYFTHHLNEIRDWLQVKWIPIIPDDLCVINFRGGEYTQFPELFLQKDYWDKAIEIMKDRYPLMRFEVHTDDPETARQFFPGYPIVSDMEKNWSAIRYAKYLILSNSSFAILPALLGNASKIIAPRYWARHNTEVWALPQNYYKRFTYI